MYKQQETNTTSVLLGYFT